MYETAKLILAIIGVLASATIITGFIFIIWLAIQQAQGKNPFL